ncbi:DUF4124 domain-containing protein [Vulcaniibacterium tengchongense]|uniref:DUF4124 domain-containing protein n=1 Tax=Vulcaniibacterium tengchongense TaxID=1273429 RepID=A0A3N4VE42_9GAMM|nr:DUF4124 domain-containing protein [Vulcaniibacterium tengchongense]RPE80908.1 hypothetical protein EDC50_0075 [Vulcaniibacterium tengchongense]
MPRPSLALLAPAFALAFAAAPAWAQQIRRCTGPDGEAVFTDRRCEELGGVDRRPPAADAARAPRGGCARTLEALTGEIATAFDGRDPNRLAAVYHWAGMSGSAAYAIMERLDALVRRPLVAIVPVLPAAPEPPPGEWRTLGGAGGDADTDLDPDTGLEEPHPPARAAAPVALRLEQTLGDGVTPSRTVFALRRHFGCWWVRF